MKFAKKHAIPVKLGLYDVTLGILTTMVPIWSQQVEYCLSESYFSFTLVKSDKIRQELPVESLVEGCSQHKNHYH